MATWSTSIFVTMSFLQCCNYKVRGRHYRSLTLWMYLLSMIHLMNYLLWPIHRSIMSSVSLTWVRIDNNLDQKGSISVTVRNKLCLLRILSIGLLMNSSSCVGMGWFGGNHMRNSGILVRISAFLTIFQIHSPRDKPKYGKYGLITPKIGTTRSHLSIARKICHSWSFCIVGSSLPVILFLPPTHSSDRDHLLPSWWTVSRSWETRPSLSEPWCTARTTPTKYLGFRGTRRESTSLVVECCRGWWWRVAETVK